MNEHHDAIKMLVEAEKALMRARAICCNAAVEDEINLAHDRVMAVGDKMYPQIIQEARKAYSEVD